MKTITNPSYRAFALFALGCFALSPQARATCQDACLTNGNTAQGDDALLNNTVGGNNTAFGASALKANISADNAAFGAFALLNNTIGAENTATGQQALLSNTTGVENTATGAATLINNTIGVENTANGAFALLLNTDGSENTAVGADALRHNRRGSNNIAVGVRAGVNITTTSNNIDIGNRGVARDAATIRIGTVGTHTNTFIAGISGVTVAGGVGLIVDSNGQLGTIVSSARYKEKIKAMGNASEAILALQPVSFHYKKELDPTGIPQFGLVAEEVAKIDPDLVARDNEGKPYTVRYEAVNAMLLNEFLKEHRKVEQQEKRISELTASLQAVNERIDALIASRQHSPGE